MALLFLPLHLLFPLTVEREKKDAAEFSALNKFGVFF